MHPSAFAIQTPDKPAVIIAETGETLTYRALDAASNQGAQLFRSLGLRPGDAVGVYLGNVVDYFPVVWAAQRAGLLYVCLPSKLTTPEAEYILRDSGCRMIVAGADLPAVAGLVDTMPDLIRFSVGEARGYRSWADGLASMPTERIADETAGSDMLYSSGTTGRPKGLRPALPEDSDIAAPNTMTRVVGGLFGVNQSSVYLCPAPLYHAAPLRWSMTVQRFGGTVVLLAKFDPEVALAAIARYRVTHSQWVPTHFIRMLKLPDAVRLSYDVSSLTCAVHAAAPCPAPVKHRMIEWWGPILVEYYAGTEGNGMTMIDSAEWLTHPGSVGKSVMGILRICDDEGLELPAGSEGAIYFEAGNAFIYHNDPEKTAAASNAQGWTTLGDIGRVDLDGYLYLTDRKSFMIISGGVNIYPQEIENVLIGHPAVADVAVIGAPDPEMGERVVAVIQPENWEDATPEFASELAEWVRDKLSAVKRPKQIDFRQSLPRHDTGKLYKRLLRDEYWGRPDQTIV
ncbi:acyl-CoA synthetase [soil metagenome]